MQHIINAQGLNMPKLGLGTWPMLGECSCSIAALDVRLDDEDRALSASLPKRERQVSPDFAPEWDAFDE